MKTKIKVAIVIVFTAISVTACVEEEVKVAPPSSNQTTTGVSNTHVPIK